MNRPDVKRVLIIAEEHFGRNIVNLIENETKARYITFRDWKRKSFLARLSAIITADYIHHFGGTCSRTLINGSRLFRKRLIIHFTGTDVFNILNASPEEQHRIKILLTKAWKLAATGRHLADELNSVGIAAVEYVPFCVFHDDSGEIPGPVEDAVLLYMPKGKEDFYGLEVFRKYFAAFPRVNFYVMANDGIEGCVYPNVKYLGWIENVDEYLRRCKIYARHTRHDGLPNLVLQALSKKRHVFYNHEFPHCHIFDRNLFRDIIENWRPNDEGRQYVLCEFSKDKITKRFLDLYE
jgi:glycosyltransferase involved in cell wall biosynthesis